MTGWVPAARQQACLPTLQVPLRCCSATNLSGRQGPPSDRETWSRPMQSTYCKTLALAGIYNIEINSLLRMAVVRIEEDPTQNMEGSQRRESRELSCPSYRIPHQASASYLISITIYAKPLPKPAATTKKKRRESKQWLSHGSIFSDKLVFFLYPVTILAHTGTSYFPFETNNHKDGKCSKSIRLKSRPAAPLPRN